VIVPPSEVPDRLRASEPRFARTRLSGNQLLNRLPDGPRQAIEAQLQRVPLKAGQVLFRAHESLEMAYFPESGVVSLLARTGEGETLDVGVVGKDGMAGVAMIPGSSMMPYDALVQIGGTARRIRSDAVRPLIRQFAPLHELLGRYAYSRFASGIQTAVCNNFHPIQPRCARWLLMIHDLVEGDMFPLTQSLLARMLGVRRPTVTIAASAIQHAGLVEYHHGRMTILDRPRLEAEACECYELVRAEQFRLLGY
jgi:CRP-like cAMP-binding protein